MTTAYTIRDFNKVVRATPTAHYWKIYDKPLKELTSDEKPRERLRKYGATALSTEELISVILGVGTKKEDVLSMARRLSREYGEKGLSSHKNPEELSHHLGVPLVKASQVVASIELGRRLFDEKGKGVVFIRTAKDVFEHTRDIRELPQEHLRGLYLNARHQLVRDVVIAIGTVNANIAHPREVFKPAIDYSAVAMVLVHNHPSGSVKPSEDDIEMTRQLVEAGKVLGIDLLDHVIVSKNGFTSIPVDYH